MFYTWLTMYLWMNRIILAHCVIHHRCAVCIYLVSRLNFVYVCFLPKWMQTLRQTFPYKQTSHFGQTKSWERRQSWAKCKTRQFNNLASLLEAAGGLRIATRPLLEEQFRLLSYCNIKYKHQVNTLNLTHSYQSLITAIHEKNKN